MTSLHLCKRLLPLGVLALIFSTSLLAPGQASADPDPWLGRDKALHFGASAALAMGGYAAGAWIWDEQGPALLTGAGLALGAGIGKELLDLAGMGHPSWKDFAWDVVGTGAGLALAWGVHALLNSGSSEEGRGPSGSLQGLSYRGGVGRAGGLLQIAW